MQYTTGEKKIINHAWVRLIDYLERRPDCLHRAVEGYVREEVKQSRSPSFRGFSRQEARLYVMRELLAGLEQPGRAAHELANIRPTLALAFIIGARIGANADHEHAAVLERLAADLRSAVVAHSAAFRRYSQAVIRKAKGEE